MNWEPPTEKEEQPEDKQVCKICGNDTFIVYIKISLYVGIKQIKMPI